MEDIKKEENVEIKVEEPKKETYSKEEVDNLINSKIASIFGDILKEINKPKEVVETPKEKTIKELKF